MGTNILDGKTICEVAIKSYGEYAQETMLFEEMAELQNAICKVRRNRATADDVCEEIADVIIMCNQMALIYGKEKVDVQIQHKLLRLAKRLNMV